MKMYTGNAKRTGAAEVARIAAPILVTGPAETKRRKGRRKEPAGSENVVSVMFRK